VVAGRQRDCVDVWQKRGRKNPHRRAGTVRRLDLLADWLGQTGTHEVRQVAVFAQRYVATWSTYILRHEKTSSPISHLQVLIKALE